MLKTKRLYLRNFHPSDADILFDYRNDQRCSLYQRYDDTSYDYLCSFVSKFSGCRFLSVEEEQHYAIVRSETDEMIGDISIFFNEADNCFTLGVTICPDSQRQGFAYELLREVTEKINLKYPRFDIVALIEKENVGSIALFKKLGFVEECYAESIGSYVYIIYGKEA